MPTSRLRLPDPYDRAGVLDFLAIRTVDGIDAVVGNAYVRTGVEVTVGERRAEVRSDLADAGSRARRLLDVDTDPDAVCSVLARDPVLAPLLAANPGVRVPGAWDPFEVLVRAVVGQQVTVAAARTLLARVADRCGGTITPAALAAADLGAVGMPRSRVDTLRAVAEEPDDLLAVRGIGPWTAGYVALRSGDADGFPIGDAGLRQAAGPLGLPTDHKALAAHAERWRPYRAYAVVLLWSTLTA